MTTKINMTTGAAIGAKIDIPDDWGLKPAPPEWRERWTKHPDYLSDIPKYSVRNTYGTWVFHGWETNNGKVVSIESMIINPSSGVPPHIGNLLAEHEQKEERITAREAALREDNWQLRQQVEELKIELAQLNTSHDNLLTDYRELHDRKIPSENASVLKQQLSDISTIKEQISTIKKQTEQAIETMTADIKKYLNAKPVEGFVAESKYREVVTALMYYDDLVTHVVNCTSPCVESTPAFRQLKEFWEERYNAR